MDSSRRHISGRIFNRCRDCRTCWRVLCSRSTCNCYRCCVHPHFGIITGINDACNLCLETGSLWFPSRTKCLLRLSSPWCFGPSIILCVTDWGRTPITSSTALFPFPVLFALSLWRRHLHFLLGFFAHSLVMGSLLDQLCPSWARACLQTHQTPIQAYSLGLRLSERKYLVIDVPITLLKIFERVSLPMLLYIWQMSLIQGFSEYWELFTQF